MSAAKAGSREAPANNGTAAKRVKRDDFMERKEDARIDETGESG